MRRSAIFPRRLRAALIGAALASTTTSWASPYDYAYGSMGHYNEVARERAFSSYMSSSSNYSSSGSSQADKNLRDAIAKLRDLDRPRPAQSNYSNYQNTQWTETRRPAPPPRDINKEIIADSMAKARAGNRDEMYAIGYMYVSGNLNMPKDATQALYWYEKAAAAGHHEGMRASFLMLSRGEGVPVNMPRAMTWLRKYAESGDLTAQIDLGDRLINGKDVAADIPAGIHFFELAIAQGDTQAARHLLAAYAVPTGPAHDPAKGLALLRSIMPKASAADVVFYADTAAKLLVDSHRPAPEARAELVEIIGPAIPEIDGAAREVGILLMGDALGSPDIALSAKYFEIAAGLGDPYAVYHLMVLYSSHDDGQYRPKQALKYIRSALEKQPDLLEMCVYLLLRLAAERGEVDEPDLGEIVALLMPAAEKLPVDSRMNARAYAFAESLDEDPARKMYAAPILKFYHRVADGERAANYGDAAYRLSEIYAKGELTAADLTLAAKYHLQAVQNQSKLAMYRDAVRLRDGDGVARDPAAAFAKFAEFGFATSETDPFRQRMQRAGIELLKSELARSTNPAALVSMLTRLRFGDSNHEMTLWSIEEEIRVDLRFPDYYDENISRETSTLSVAAQEGRAGAYHWLAVNEARGSSMETAIEYAKHGVDAGDLECKNLLGLWRWEGSKGRDAASVALIKEAADGGVVSAVYNLARVYEVSPPPLRDDVKARDGYMRAAGELPEAKRQLAAMWAEGRGGPADVAQGLALLRAAAAEDRGAAYFLGNHLLSGDWGERNVAAGVKSLEAALAKGEWRAGIDLAWFYHSGSGGAVDEVAARRFLDATVERAKHDPFTVEANQQVGEALWNGTSAPADPEAAIKLMDGAKTAQAYRTGRGGSKDLRWAETTALKAQQTGDAEGSVELGEIALLNGRSEEARQQFESAAQAGSARGLERLADCWDTGAGGPADKSMAEHFRKLAAQMKTNEG